jgi:ADP-heptose:LPS heptosyltransferase
MRMRFLPAALILGCVWAGCLRADLKPALAESNLGKRSKLALDNAAAALKAAREAYAKGDNEKVAAAADEIQQSVDLAYDSLMKTGKNPRNSPRWFKPAEISTRDLAKKLDTFQRDMDFADRPLLDKVRARVQQVHDELLLGLMEGKRK